MIPCEACDTMVRFNDYLAHVRRGCRNNSESDEEDEAMSHVRVTFHVPPPRPSQPDQQLLQPQPDEQLLQPQPDHQLLQAFFPGAAPAFAFSQAVSHGPGDSRAPAPAPAELATTGRRRPRSWTSEAMMQMQPGGAQVLNLLNMLADPTGMLIAHLADASQNTYEGNLRLAETLGSVPVGVSSLDSVSARVAAEAVAEGDVCPICQDGLGNAAGAGLRRLTCSHTYCEPCIAEWLKSSKKCPVCMAQLED